MKYTIAAVIIVIIAAIFYNKVYIVKSTFKTIEPIRGDLHVSIRGIGNVDAKDIYNITAQSGGKIEDIYFDEGERVKKGDLLLTIDAVELPMLLDEAKISLESAKYEAKSAKGDLESLEAQKSLVQATYNRYEKLIAQKFATQAEYDKAKSDLQNINARIEASKAQIASARSQERRVQKSIEAIEAKLERLNIYSPIDGYVITKEAQKSQYVLPSTTVFKIVDPKTLWIKANIDERVADKVKLMQKASISLRSRPDEKLPGIVSRIVATSNLVTLEREIAVSFETIPTPFYINEQAEVNVEVQEYKDVLKVPLNLIVKYKGEKGVWVAKDEEAYFKPISVLAQSYEYAAISSGVDANTQLLIYTNSNKPLSNGMKIFR